MTLGVNFDSDLASHSDVGNGWFVYHTDTGILHWDPNGAAHGATAVSSSTSHFALSSGDFFVIDL